MLCRLARTAGVAHRVPGDAAGGISQRIADSPEGSYTARLFASGVGRITQKSGEEGVETALAAVTRDDPELVGECADLLYHLLVLLKSRNLTLEQVVGRLRRGTVARVPGGLSSTRLRC